LENYTVTIYYKNGNKDNVKLGNNKSIIIIPKTLLDTIILKIDDSYTTIPLFQDNNLNNHLKKISVHNAVIGLNYGAL
jgi:hypothetical protein